MITAEESIGTENVLVVALSAAFKYVVNSEVCPSAPYHHMLASPSSKVTFGSTTMTSLVPSHKSGAGSGQF